MANRPNKEPTLAKRVELLAVKDRFQFNGLGLILEPDFRVPNNWKNVEELVLVVKPDGTKIEVHARIKVAHFNVRNPGSQSRRGLAWRVVIVLHGIEKIGVPSGSKILVSPSTRSVLLKAEHGSESA